MSSHPSRKPRVAVVFGGRSSEHAVSCATAAGVLRAIDRDTYDVVPVGITRDGAWVLAADDPDALMLTPGSTPEVTDTGTEVILPTRVGQSSLSVHRPGEALEALGEVDVVFPLLHGPYGEDGTLQGMLELTDIRYVGSGVLASAAGMDKHYMKVVFEGAGLPVGPYVVITDTQWRRDKAAAMDSVGALTYPVFVKPCRAGSSMGVSKVDGPGCLEAAIEAAREHDLKVIVESGIVGREIECAVLQGRGLDAPRTSMPGEIVVEAGHGHDFYDFEAKYLDEASVVLSCPADLPPAVADEVRRLAAAAFESLACEGLSRVDCFVTESGEVVINEINTMPGFTPHSMYPRMWQASGVSYPELVDELIQLALERPVGLR
ncbi:D-alanine--D-alanine ligase family protein [Janibacter limosus]|jgi:D-alanine-D-alanine ligase|uniref:D-alanine--D-alanine ligase n=1 Tax=Janibacter limosus TaxID=53458 RepID=A0A4P6MXB5_9MICO|nr:D-alanine--D-alanine ligase family protein [Janibacter limosus]QBF46555.1 D-alanine--D-alanine ligase [Janibacter limosus]